MLQTDLVPLSFGYAGLAVLLQRSVGSLQADMCRKPDSLPPACRIPGTRQPIWLRQDVLDWLAEHREIRAPEKRNVGRPHKKPSAASQQGGGQ